MASAYTTAVYASAETIDRLPLRVFLELLYWRTPIVCVDEQLLPQGVAFLIVPPPTLTVDDFPYTPVDLKWPDYDRQKHLLQTRMW